MIKIGFLVNPIAGMGGSVGLKGTDGMVGEALRLGAKPLAYERAIDALKDADLSQFLFLTVAEKMGENTLKEVGANFEAVADVELETTADDTKKACEKILENGAELLVFCGGDGTARDVFEVVGDKIPVVGIPAGVKMHSSIFAVNPKAVGELLKHYASGNHEVMDAEIMDVDEQAYRENHLRAKVYGIAKTISEPKLIQSGKAVFEGISDGRAKEDIAEYVAENMRDRVLYILGAGSTLGAVKEKLGFKGTLLGVDVVKDRKVVGEDVNEETLLELLQKNKDAKIIVSPIGAQGFVFGRGNQQISPKVIEKVGVENIQYVSTPAKLEGLKELRVDTGDEKVDKMLCGYQSVLIGYRFTQRRDVVDGFT
ncbi:MAG TPA: ATP-NAD kinase [Candidatus Altiarchaeales archaeon]|nr:ATP-NAD kinase [Candidatus Altiarchaeales archaeon]